MQVHLYDFRWLDETHMEFQASYMGRQFARKKVQIGDTLSMELKSSVRCAGSVRDDVWMPCPDKVFGRKKCEVCRKREGNFIFTAFDGFNTDTYSPEDLALMEGDHVIYLALFDQSLYKVGVSKATRKIMRQIEQGSHHTLFIAQTPNGILARQIETILCRSGVADKIRASMKQDFLWPEVTREEGENFLRKIFSDHIPSLQEFQELQKFVHDHPEFYDWEHIYQMEPWRKTQKSYHDVKLAEGESVSGKLIAKKGAFLILELPHEIVSINTKDLIGYEIEFDEKPPGLNLKQALQSSLF